MPWARVPVTMLSTPPPAPGSPPAAATLISPGGNLQTGVGGGGVRHQAAHAGTSHALTCKRLR